MEILAATLVYLYYIQEVWYRDEGALSVDTLIGRIGKVVASHAEGCKIESRLWLSCTDLYYPRCAQGVLLMRVGGAISQLDLPSPTLVVVDCN